MGTVCMVWLGLVLVEGEHVHVYKMQPGDKLLQVLTKEQDH